MRPPVQRLSCLAPEFATSLVLTVIRDPQRALIVGRGQRAKGVHALHASLARSVQRRAPARTVQLYIRWAPVLVNREIQINPRASWRARIDLLLVPTVRHLVVDLVHVPPEPARKIVVAHCRWTIGSRLRLRHPRNHRPRLLSIARQVVLLRGRLVLLCFRRRLLLWLHLLAQDRNRLLVYLLSVPWGSAAPAPGSASPWSAHSCSPADCWAAAAHCSPGSPASRPRRPGSPTDCDETARPETRTTRGSQ